MRAPFFIRSESPSTAEEPPLLRLGFWQTLGAVAAGHAYKDHKSPSAS